MTRRSEDRPRWAERLRWWATDYQYDHLSNESAEWRWGIRAALIGWPLLRGLCLLFGHGEDWEGRCIYCSTPGKGWADRGD